MQAEIYKIVVLIWLLGGIVWVLNAMRAKQTVQRQSARSRYLHIAAMVLAFLLLFTGDLRFGVLARRFVPHTPDVPFIGLALMLLGLMMAVWARTTLGSNWSGAVTVKQGHQLIRRGPYALVRHPIYTGLLSMVAGTALVIGEVRCIAAFVVAAVAFHVKSRMEERFMMERFGAQYEDYRRRVKALVPWVL